MALKGWGKDMLAEAPRSKRSLDRELESKIIALRVKRSHLMRIRRQWFDWRELQEDLARSMGILMRERPDLIAHYAPRQATLVQDATIARLEVADIDTDLDLLNLEIWSLQPRKTTAVLV